MATLDPRRIAELLASYTQTLAWEPDALERRPDLPSILGQDALILAALRSLSGEPGERVREMLAVAAWAGVALFAGGRATRPVPLPIAGRVRQIPPDRDASVRNFASWSSATFCGLAAGEAAAVALLGAVPPSEWLHSSSSGDRFQYDLALALRSYVTGAPDAGDHLLAALRGTDPKAIRIADPDYVLDVAVPQIEVFFALLDGDAAGFSPALRKAHELFMRHFGRLPDEPAGWLDVRLLGLATAARDAGLPVSYAAPPELPPPFPPVDATIIGCPYCLCPIVEGADVCASCARDPRGDAPVELSPDELRSNRKACRRCGSAIHALAVTCPSCRGAP